MTSGSGKSSVAVAGGIAAEGRVLWRSRQRDSSVDPHWTRRSPLLRHWCCLNGGCWCCPRWRELLRPQRCCFGAWKVSAPCWVFAGICCYQRPSRSWRRRLLLLWLVVGTLCLWVSCAAQQQLACQRESLRRGRGPGRRTCVVMSPFSTPLWGLSGVQWRSHSAWRSHESGQRQAPGDCHCGWSSASGEARCLSC